MYFSFTRSSGPGRRYEATDKSIRRPAKDRPPIRVLAPQHGAIRYGDPADVAHFPGTNQNLPSPLFHPSLRGRAVMHRATGFAIRRGERAIPSRKRVSTVM